MILDMHYKDRAKKWFERATNESDEFVKFILFFITLEVLVKINGNSIRDIKNNPPLFKGIPDGDLRQLVSELDNRPLQNMNPDGDHRWNGKIISVSDTDGIVEFIIRGRNNLFHGDKGPDEGRDLFIIQYGNKIVEPIVTALL